MIGPLISLEQSLGDHPANPADAVDPDVVATDPDCRTCGYNLRTLAWAARCPECQTLVDASRLPPWFQVRSHREIRRIRIVMALFAASILVATLAHIQFVFFCWNWLQLINAGHRPWLRYSSLVWQYGYGLIPGSIELAAIVLLAAAFARRYERTQVVIARIMIVLAAIGGVDQMRMYLGGYLPQSTPDSWSHWLLATLIWIVQTAAYLAVPLSRMLAMYLLLSLVDRMHHPCVHGFIVLSILAASLMLLGESGAAFYNVAFWMLAKFEQPVGERGYWFLDPQHDWLYRVFEFVGWWRLRMDSACWMVILAALAVFTGTWDRATRAIVSTSAAKP